MIVPVALKNSSVSRMPSDQLHSGTPEFVQGLDTILYSAGPVTPTNARLRDPSEMVKISSRRVDERPRVSTDRQN